MFIKLECDRDLIITVPSPIMRGENNAKIITYLLPKTVGDIDMQTATVYLNYIRADNTADIDLLIREETPYNKDYFAYLLPVTHSISRFPGEVRMWLQIFDGPAEHPIVAKSGECIINVTDSMSMGEYITDKSINAVCEMYNKIIQREEGNV